MSSNSQNARETKRPEEMVRSIYLAIPSGSDVDDPIEDAALMARIGAKRIEDSSRVDVVWTEYELKNATTAARFTFKRHKFIGGSLWMLNRTP